MMRTQGLMSLTYHDKIFKRVIHRPYNYHWYPYMDVVSPSFDFQLSLFYGKLNLRFSIERYCASCNSILKEEEIEFRKSPIALCSSCRKDLYHGYWDCIAKITDLRFHFHPNKTMTDNKPEARELISCSDLFSPNCGFPINSERQNPCFKHHAIGLVLKDFCTLNIVVAPLETLKYRMISEGGILGVILGQLGRIFNIKSLEKTFYQIILNIKTFLKSFNNGKENIVKLFDNTINERLNTSFILSFLGYYPYFDTKSLISMILKDATEFFTLLIKHLFRSEEIKLDILEFHELYRYYPPINHFLRSHVERRIFDEYNVKSIRQFSRNLKQDISLHCMNSEGLSNINQRVFHFINGNRLKIELEIHEIIGSFGRNVIILSNQDDEPVIISINHLIGRKLLDY